VPYLSERLVHVVTRADLATLLTPTYAESAGVDDEEAHDRLTRALADPEVLDELYRCLSDALVAKAGRLEPDALMDKLAKRVSLKKGHMKPASATAAISAAVVRINLVLGLAPDSMRLVIESEKGKAALAQGLRALGTHLVQELLK
jgi:hypothetical protein